MYLRVPSCTDIESAALKLEMRMCYLERTMIYTFFKQNRVVEYKYLSSTCFTLLASHGITTISPLACLMYNVLKHLLMGLLMLGYIKPLGEDTFTYHLRLFDY